MAVQRETNEAIHYGDPGLTGGMSVLSWEFDEAYGYEGNDLGAVYNLDRTVFGLWAPTASEAKVVLFADWQGEAQEEQAMLRGLKGEWKTEIPGDWHGVYYSYRVKIGDKWNEAVDPYARAVGMNGNRGVVVDLALTNPEGWGRAVKPALAEAVDAVIYEVHVRDLTIHPESGVAHKGKYLGAAQTGTKGPNGVPTGLDHIRDLGVTHVQFLPIYDYSYDSVDESRLHESQYNWGYDPQNYNAPEGSYATDAVDPLCRIRELKTMIQACHDNGLRVIMDVVYNHVFDAYRMNFTKLVPGYYFRYTDDNRLSDGSGCGNDTASERRMVRKFIVDSVLYWAREYRIDGFRFDLMGLHDVDTMNAIRAGLDALDPTILMLGEGWHMGTPLPEEMKANQGNAGRMPRIAQFNDSFRDTLKGSVFHGPDPGFASGKPHAEHDLKRGIVGGVAHWAGLHSFAHEPNQSVSYAECHDNLTLWDKLLQAMPGELEETLRRSHRLVSSILLTSQGIPFLHAGQEFMRTKGGDHNSYRSPTEVNWMDWRRRAERSADVEHVKQLIALRKAHPAFRMPKADQIREHLIFEECSAGGVAYTLREHANGDAAKHLFVVHNGTRGDLTAHVPALGAWRPLFGAEDIVSFGVGSSPSELTVRGFSCVILECRD
ncbi:pullulanase [Paenibacillus swuensis]|uniref:Pullulanase n=1 Tax=Paenibacillus swuensis TaxID=1178515 RepID=A0A172TI54_9BACL|nr:type I pullulanase [Paenibacillus swuensis]ANE46642.1 pullulanase [Paenibacillus swuensis]